MRRRTETPAMRHRHFTERPQADRVPLGHQLSTNGHIRANDHFLTSGKSFLYIFDKRPRKVISEQKTTALSKEEKVSGRNDMASNNCRVCHWKFYKKSIGIYVHRKDCRGFALANILESVQVLEFLWIVARPTHIAFAILVAEKPTMWAVYML